MTKTFLKRIIFSFLIIITLLILIVGARIYFRPDKTISKLSTTISDNGITFSFPKNLYVENLGVTSGKSYKSYRIYDREFPGVIGSNIRISIPINNNDALKELRDNLRPEFAAFILPIVVNKHKGEFVTYHLSEQLPGDRPVQAQNTKIYLNSNYANTPLILSYTKYDGGNSLDDAWEMIIKTLEY